MCAIVASTQMAAALNDPVACSRSCSTAIHVCELQFLDIVRKLKSAKSWHGHCAPYIHRASRSFPDGLVRVSPGVFNTSDDIDKLTAALREIVLI